MPILDDIIKEVIKKITSIIIDRLLRENVLEKLIYLIYKYKRQDLQNKESFESRAKVFHSRISPVLVEHLTKDSVIGGALYKYRPKINDKDIKILPFAVLISPGKPVKLPKSLLREKNQLHQDDELIKWLQSDLEREVVNRPTFSLHGITEDGTLSIGIGNYYSTMSTSDIHYFNLIKYFPLSMQKYKINLLYIPSRPISTWIKSLKEILQNRCYSQYTASIGCSVLTVIRRNQNSKKEYQYLIIENSPAKGSAAVDMHVVPSFMFQPHSAEESLRQQADELDLELAVLVEYGEELLGCSEFNKEVVTLESLKDKINQAPALCKLKSAIESGRARLYITGMILDIYRLRPEITLLLIIEDSTLSNDIKTNWETKRIRTFDLYDEEKYLSLINSAETPLCPPGLASLIFGREKAIEVLKDKKRTKPQTHTP